MKKKFSFLVLAAITCLVSAAAFVYPNADFSGEWTLNKSKSELGQWGERIAPKKLKIDGKTHAVAIDRFSVNQSGAEVITNEKLTFDGKESENTIFGNSKKKSVAKWSEDGQTLNVNSTIFLDRNGETTEIKVTELWKLIDNGQALSLESTSNSSFGTSTMKLVYDKSK